MNLAIVGMQWGDEGKGKIVDYLAPDFDVAVRYNGGNNAGHSVETETGERKRVHLLPAAVFRGTRCVLGRGMVIDPMALVQEIRRVEADLGIRPDVLVDSGAHLILPHHREADASRESKTDRPIGTTRSGNGPAYADKMNRQGMRVGDLLRSEHEIEEALTRAGGGYALPVQENNVVETLRDCGDELAPYIGNAGYALNRWMDKGKRVLFVGAHGAMLDMDHGTYPFVTSSTCTTAGIGTAGVDPRQVHFVLGVTKAYCTRIGTGPFPTEILGDLADHIRETGREYGTTTGRPRRVGWLDLVALKHAIEINGVDFLSLSMLDVLGGVGAVHAAVAYRQLEDVLNRPPMHTWEYEEDLIAEYEVVQGWVTGQEDFGTIRVFEDLPRSAKDYVQLIEEYAGVRVALISTGPRRDQVIDRGILPR